jgi:hypothetical protein
MSASKTLQQHQRLACDHHRHRCVPLCMCVVVMCNSTQTSPSHSLCCAAAACAAASAADCSSGGSKALLVHGEQGLAAALHQRHRCRRSHVRRCLAALRHCTHALVVPATASSYMSRTPTSAATIARIRSYRSGGERLTRCHRAQSRDYLQSASVCVSRVNRPLTKPARKADSEAHTARGRMQQGCAHTRTSTHAPVTRGRGKPALATHPSTHWRTTRHAAASASYPQSVDSCGSC